MWGLIWLAAALLCVAVLYPTYVLLSGTVAAYSTAMRDSATEAQAKSMQRLQQAIVYSGRVTELEQRPAPSPFLKDINAIADQLPVTIESISITNSATSTQPITVLGTAETREALTSFRAQLLLQPYVTQVPLPIDNFAPKDELPFVLQIVVTDLYI